MEKTTTELTREYIKEHPHIQSCLKKDLINYSSLARLIAKELNIEKKTSKEAILIAARRYQEKLTKETGTEKQIKDLLDKSEISIKNKILVYVLEKSIDFEIIDDLQKNIRKDYGIFYLIEGSDHYIIITQEKYSALLEGKLKNKLIKKNTSMALIMIKTQKEIEETPGVAAYLTSLFAENGVNIIELLSCWTDTLFIVESKDVNRTIQFLKF